MSGRMSFLRESTWVVIHRLILVVIVVGNDILLARILGPDGKGYYTILVVTPVLLASVAAGGLDFSLNQLAHRRPARAFSIFNTAAGLGLIGGLGLASLLWFDVLGIGRALFQGVPREFAASLRLAALAIPTEVLFLLAGMLAVSVGRPLAFSRARIVRRGTMLGATLVAAALFRHRMDLLLLAVLWGFVGAAIVSGAVSLLGAGFRGGGFDRNVGEVLKHAAASYPGRVAERLQTRVDVALLGILGSGAQVGVYSVATGMAEAVLLISNSIATVLFGRHAEQQSALHARALRLMVPLSAVLAASVAVGGTVLIPVLWGDRFQGGVLLLALLLPGVVFFSLVQTVTPSLVQAGRGGAVSVAHAVGLAGNILLNILMIPWLGAAAASLASSASYGITLAILLGAVRMRDGVSLRRLVVMNREDLSIVRARLRAFLEGPVRFGQSGER